MTAALDELLRLVPPPAGQGGPFDWSPTEEILGTRLPQDYKNLLDAYGDVSFGHEVDLFCPSISPYEDLATHTLEMRDILTTNIKYGDGAEYPDYLPDGVRYVPEELIYWGSNKSSYNFSWHTGDSDPAKWTIVNTWRLGVNDWAFYDGTVTEYLLQWLRGELTDLQYVPYDRDASNDWQTPFCIFYPLGHNPGTDPEPPKTVIEELADTVGSEEEFLARQGEWSRFRAAAMKFARPSFEFVPGSIPMGESADNGTFYGLPSTFPEPPAPEPPHTLASPSPALAAAKKAGAITPDLQRLLDLVPPPPDRDGYDWSDIENHFGHRFPRDYTTLVDIYGRTFFANTFLISPPEQTIPGFSADHTYHLSTQTDRLREQLKYPRERWHPDSLPAHQEIDPGRYICWGNWYTNEFHTWHIIGDDPDQWPILLIDCYFRNWYTHHGTVTNLILRHLTGDLTPPELPLRWDLDARMIGERPHVIFDGPDFFTRRFTATTLPPRDAAPARNLDTP